MASLFPDLLTCGNLSCLRCGSSQIEVSCESQPSRCTSLICNIYFSYLNHPCRCRVHPPDEASLHLRGGGSDSAVDVDADRADSPETLVTTARLVSSDRSLIVPGSAGTYSSLLLSGSARVGRDEPCLGYHTKGQALVFLDTDGAFTDVFLLENVYDAVLGNPLAYERRMRDSIRSAVRFCIHRARYEHALLLGGVWRCDALGLPALAGSSQNLRPASARRPCLRELRLDELDCLSPTQRKIECLRITVDHLAGDDYLANKDFMTLAVSSLTAPDKIQLLPTLELPPVWVSKVRELHDRSTRLRTVCCYCRESDQSERGGANDCSASTDDVESRRADAQIISPPSDYVIRPLYRWCTGCGQDKRSDLFSKNQLRSQHSADRKCKECKLGDERTWCELCRNYHDSLAEVKLCAASIGHEDSPLSLDTVASVFRSSFGLSAAPAGLRWFPRIETCSGNTFLTHGIGAHPGELPGNSECAGLFIVAITGQRFHPADSRGISKAFSLAGLAGIPSACPGCLGTVGADMVDSCRTHEVLRGVWRCNLRCGAVGSYVGLNPPPLMIELANAFSLGVFIVRSIDASLRIRTNEWSSVCDFLINRIPKLASVSRELATLEFRFATAVAVLALCSNQICDSALQQLRLTLSPTVLLVSSRVATVLEPYAARSSPLG